MQFVDSYTILKGSNESDSVCLLLRDDARKESVATVYYSCYMDIVSCAQAQILAT